MRLYLLVALCMLLTNFARTHAGQSENSSGWFTQQLELWEFAEPEHWTVHWLDAWGDRPFTTRMQPNAFTLKFAPKEHQRHYAAYSPTIKSTKRFAGLQTITLDIELAEGNAVDLSPVFTDHTGEGLIFTRQKLKPGRHTYTWDLSKPVVHAWGGDGNRKPNGELQLWSLNLKLEGKGTTTLHFHHATAHQRRHALEFIDADLTTGHPIVLVIPDQPHRAELNIVNTFGRSLHGDITITTKYFNGQSEESTQLLSIGPNANQSIVVPDDNKQLGIRWVTWKLVAADGFVRTGESSYAVMQPAGPTLEKADPRQFIFGMCQHSSRYSDDIAEREVMASALVGAKVLRSFVPWGAINPQRGKWNFKRADRIVALAEKYHVELAPDLGLAAKWAVSDEARAKPGWQFQFYPPVDPNDYATFTGKCAERYRGRIRFWEIWNEPDLSHFWRGTTDEYIEMLRLSYAAIKQVDPNAQVLCGGMSGFGGHPGKKLNPKMHQRVLAEAHDAFDIYAVHQHGTFDVFNRLTSKYLPGLRASMPDGKPIWFNETAMHSTTLGEREQAITLAKKLLLARQLHAMGYNWYNLRDSGTNPTNPEHNYGLLKHDFHPKAAYVVYNTLAKTLRGTKHHVGAAPGQFMNLSRGQKHDVVHGWIEGNDRPDSLHAVWSDHPVVQIDLMGNERVLPAYHGTTDYAPTPSGRTSPPYRSVVAFTLDRKVTMIKSVAPPAEPTPVARLIAPSVVKTIQPGQPVALKVDLNNPWGVEMVFQLEWVLPDTVQAEQGNTKQAQTVRKLHSIESKLKVKANPHARRIAYDEPVEAKLRYEIVGTPFRGELRVPIPIAIATSTSTSDNTPATFTMANRKQVVSLVEGDPSLASLVWTGPDDLSAKVWLAVTDDQLQLRADVTDDVHQQPHAAGKIWQADSIQFGISIQHQPGWWELGLAQTSTGEVTAHCWRTPTGMADPTAQAKVNVERTDGLTTYRIDLPLKTLGATIDQLTRDGIKFNLIVNDADAGRREGWVQITRGLGEAKRPALFCPVVIPQSPRAD